MLPITDVRVKTVTKYGSKFRGFELSTPSESTSVYALIEDFQSCCETYGFCITVENEESVKQSEICCHNSSGVDRGELDELRRVLVGQHILNVGWGKISTESRTDPQTNSVEVCVQTVSDWNIRLTLFNTHNGYYAHDTIVKWDGLQDDTNAL
jgi:hypothetical protein